MRGRSVGLALALCACSEQKSAGGGIVYEPHQVLAIPADGDIADPDVIRIDGTWYLYATNTQIDFEVWTSDDLAIWRSGGKVWTPTPGSWNQARNLGGAWAPHVQATPEG